MSKHGFKCACPLAHRTSNLLFWFYTIWVSQTTTGEHLPSPPPSHCRSSSSPPSPSVSSFDAACEMLCYFPPVLSSTAFRLIVYVQFSSRQHLITSREAGPGWISWSRKGRLQYNVSRSSYFPQNIAFLVLITMSLTKWSTLLQYYYCCTAL